MAADPYYKVCARASEGTCRGKITWEHALIYAGRQIQEKWAIIPLCEWHHAVNKFQDSGDLNKRLNELIALLRATPEDLKKYPRENWSEKINRLKKLCTLPKARTLPDKMVI
tara:strand:+ start:339 stop:674 length:336 start_codon:yes stop_codon:yes gene_type:complete